MTLHGDTPRGDSRSVDTPSITVSDLSQGRRDSGDFNRTFSGRFTPTFVPRHVDHDVHDREVHDIMINCTDSSTLVAGAGRDVCSSRGSRPSPFAQQSSPTDDRNLAVSMDNFNLGNPNSAFKSRPETKSSAKSRKLGARGRSLSAPIRPSSRMLPTSPEKLKLSQPEHPSTPIVVKYAYESTDPAKTHFLDRFVCVDTEISDSKKPTSRIFKSILPSMAIPESINEVSEDEDDHHRRHISRNSYSTYPPAYGTSHSLDSYDDFLEANRSVLRARNSNLVRSVSVHDSSPIISCSEKMSVIPESGEDSTDDFFASFESRDCRLSSMKKKRLSNSKKKRMFNISRRSSRRKSRRCSIFSLKKSSRQSVLTPRIRKASSGQVPAVPTITNFFPVVVGGTYHQAFEFNRPVVLENSHLFPRIHAIEMPSLISNPVAMQVAITRLRRWYIASVRSQSYMVYQAEGDDITLSILSPGVEFRTVSFSLGSHWSLVPAYPGGLLIVSTRHHCDDDKRRLCFFVPDHFLRKELLCDVEQTDRIGDEICGDSSFSMVVDLNVSVCTDATEPDDIDYMHLHSALDTSAVSDGSRCSDGRYSHNHLINFVGEDGPMDSPASSLCDVGRFSPAARANRLSSHAGSGQNDGNSTSVTSGLTKQGDIYFRSLLEDDNSALPFCRKADLMNSGDIMEIVLSFLEGCKERPQLPKIARCVSDGRLKRSRSATSDISHPVPSELYGFHAVKLVSKHWAVNWVRYLSSKWSREVWNTRSAIVMDKHYDKWVTFVKKHSNGSFVGSGGAKDVYRLLPPSSHSLVQRTSSSAYAVAVMDVKSVMENAVEQEMVVSLACSSLVKYGICPNIVKISSAFQSPYPAPSVWQTNSNLEEIPSRSSMKAGHYQYINMEYCSGGDIEDFIRKRRSKALSAVEIRQIFFQMCFSIYSCREQLSLRHFDIKLLNFFLADSSALLSNYSTTSPRNDKVYYRIGFGNSVFSLPLSLSGTSPGVVKLADFGTSLIGEEEATSNITAQQFTTLENTAPEFLFQGSAASSASFAADTFGLGLSFLHLLTGHAPYEELMERVRCPHALIIALKEIWMECDRVQLDTDSPYYVINEVLSSLDDPTSDNDEVDDSVKNVLYDTLYRYVVLIGLPNADMFTTLSSSTGRPALCRNPVVTAVLNTLDQGLNENASLEVRDATTQYLNDSTEWSIFRGSHCVMKSARSKMAEISPDAEQWLRRMLCYDPIHRYPFSWYFIISIV